MPLHTAYLPPLSWFDAARQQGYIELEAFEHYQKGSTRNRCLIAAPNGVQRLSIPLEKGKHQQTPIRDVRIAYTEKWHITHWRSIQTAYGNAPFFEYFSDELAAIFHKKTTYLYDFNLLLLEFVVKKAGWNWEIKATPEYRGTTETPHDYQPKRYAQTFEDRHGFIPDLSVLDALMCCGRHIPLI